MTDGELDAIAMSIGPVPGCFKVSCQVVPAQPLARYVLWTNQPWVNAAGYSGSWLYDARELDGKSEAETRELMQARHNHLLCSMVELAVSKLEKVGDVNK